METPYSQGVPGTTVPQDLGIQIEGWYKVLPPALKWKDTVAPGDSPAMPLPQPNLIPTLDTQPWEYIRPILQQRLKICFNRIRYTSFRPYLYKVLHHPEQATDVDVANSVLCLKVEPLHHIQYLMLTFAPDSLAL